MSALPDGSMGINGAVLGAPLGQSLGVAPDLGAYAPAMFGADLGQQLVGPGPRGGVASAGGSRGSKAPKKKDDDDALYTTVMLRNIPNKYTQQMLIEQLHRSGFRGDIDYLYLPIDFANRCNCGYCFVNFRTVAARERFSGHFDGVAVQSCLPGFNSYKVCQVTRAKWQGREENVRRLRSGPELMAQLAAHPDWLPLLLDEGGNQETFPIEAPGQAAAPVPRRQNRKGGGSMPAAVGLQAFPGFPDGFADGGFLGGCRGGKGGGFSRGAGGRRGRGGGRGVGGPGPNIFGGLPYPGLAGAAAYGGMPGMPVMTEQGLQYLPYGYGGYAAGGYMPPPYGAPGGYGAPSWNYGQEEAGFGLGNSYEADWQHQVAGAAGSPRRVDLNRSDDDDGVSVHAARAFLQSG